ncbi:MAG: DNA-binding protein, partial [Bacteroidetes bacterium]|nr:DNA-binding protein [Bacteroidota bacterium]
MRYTDNAINIIATKSFKNIGRAWINKNLKGNESPDTIVSLINKNSKQDDEVTFDDFELSKTKIINQLDKLEEFCDGIVAIGDNNFPK